MTDDSFEGSEMKKPTQCILWETPNLLESLQQDRFERLETYVDENHLMRRLLRCRECGQLYFYEFYEEIDWEDGDDPQFVTYIPVEKPDDIERLKKASSVELSKYFPRLQRDFPKDASTPTVRWVGK